MFRAERIGEAIWPEILGVGTYAISELVAASIDTSMNYSYPIAQTTVTGVAIVGGGVALGQGLAPEFTKGVFYGAGVGMVINLVRGLYEAARKETGRMRPEDFAALVPRKVGTIAAKGSKGQTGLKLNTKQLQIFTKQPGASASTARIPEIVS
jgi:hypothetical protein